MATVGNGGNDRLKFGALEVGRAVAAGLVVFHHAGSIAQQPRFFDAVPFGYHLGNFNVGVDFFFVLSGFIIAWVHWNDIGEPARVPRYALKRFLRIYPPYWAVLLPLTALYVAFPQGGIPSQRDPVNIAMSALLLPYPVPPVLGVAWTLVHEIFFYAVFAAIIAAGRKALLLLPIWFAAIVAASLLQVETFPLTFFFNPFNMEFILGVGVAVMLRHRSVPAPLLLATVGVVIFVATMLFATTVQDHPLVGRLAFGLPAAMFVAGCVELERRRPRRLPAVLALLGAASYVIYLVHPIALSFGAQALTRLPTRDLPVDIAVLLLGLIGIGAGVLFHVVVERRIASALKSLTSTRGKAPDEARATGRA
ncbi:acyltransferase family protein [Aureimonas leprariae]|uniref:Acyltransferase n=1 Tax=Plantimonas leprariae TaxID=2615207 RepID=A0A7V7PQA9_9HYPH|nr:acyltransferase [Aureimonas leprariae]KAB0680297.1 acyltransferase [Aureimonas leprariae]